MVTFASPLTLTLRAREMRLGQAERTTSRLRARPLSG
jgi:hypothetical protein